MNDSSHAPIPPSGRAGLNQRLLSSLEALSRASSYLIAVVGLVVLLGWHLDIELLQAGLPGHTPVNPATALALLLAACALWLHHQARGRPDSAPVRWLALTALLDKQGIKSSGNSMIVYTSTDDTGFTFLAEIPVDQEPKNLTKDMSISKSPEGKALKFVHRGSYDNMDNTYEAITNHLDDKKLEAKDTFIEEYMTDPLKIAEDKLVINVYVPLK